MIKKLTRPLAKLKDQLFTLLKNFKGKKLAAPLLGAEGNIRLGFKTRPQDFIDFLKKNSIKSLLSWRQTFKFPRSHGSKGPGDQRGPGKKFKWFGSHWNYEKFVTSLFAVQTRAKIHRGLFILLLCSISYSFGKLLALLTRGPEIPSQGKILSLTVEDNEIFVPQLSIVKAKNLFKTSDVPSLKNPAGNKAVDKSIICKKSEQNTSLPISLVNTIVLQDSVKSMAAVQVRGTPELRNLREGEKIDDLAEIGKIDRLNIVIKNLQTGECERVANNFDKEIFDTSRPLNILGPREGQKLIKSQQMDGIKQDGNRISISKKLINQKMSDIENILTQARAIPLQNPDGTMNFKVVEIIPGSVFSFLGLQNEDTITLINGRKIYGLNDVMNIFANITNVDNLQLTVVKDDGSEQTLDYNFSK